MTIASCTRRTMAGERPLLRREYTATGRRRPRTSSSATLFSSGIRNGLSIRCAARMSRDAADSSRAKRSSQAASATRPIAKITKIGLSLASSHSQTLLITAHRPGMMKWPKRVPFSCAGAWLATQIARIDSTKSSTTAPAPRTTRARCSLVKRASRRKLFLERLRIVAPALEPFPRHITGIDVLDAFAQRFHDAGGERRRRHLRRRQELVPFVVEWAREDVDHAHACRSHLGTQALRERMRRGLRGREGAVRREIGERLDRKPVPPCRGARQAVGAAAAHRRAEFLREAQQAAVIHVHLRARGVDARANADAVATVIFGVVHQDIDLAADLRRDLADVLGIGDIERQERHRL